jgi:transcriptional regulator with XRE-family HTH domain
MRRSGVPTWQVFGASLKSMRTSHQWGLRPFARAVRIDPGYLCLIEAGKTAPPSDEFLTRMADVLDVPRTVKKLVHSAWQVITIVPKRP